MSDFDNTPINLTEKELRKIEKAQVFFMALEAKYEGDGEPVDGAPIGPFGEIAEAISQLLLDLE